MPASASAIILSLLILVWMVRLQLTPRRIRPDRLWLWPVLVLLFALSTLSGDLKIILTPVGIASIGAGLIVGCAIGYWRASLYRYQALGESGQLMRQGSWLTLAIWLLPFIVRLAVETLAHGILWLEILSVALIAMSLGSSILLRIGIYRRYMQHRATTQSNSF